MCGSRRNDKIQNDYIQGDKGVALIKKKIIEID